MPPTILIAAGGTAGHVVPALAVADALQAEAGARVVFVGGERAEKTLVPEAGYELRSITVEGLSRSNPLKAARGAVRAAAALRTARKILREVRPDAVMGGGGYVAGPVGAAAVASRIPLVLTEADSHLGLTNRLLARFARRVCLAFPLAGRDDPAKYLVTGRPVPPPVADRAAARAMFGLGDEERCVLVFGGSLGARSINEAAIDAFGEPIASEDAAAGPERIALQNVAAGPEVSLRILHACGTRDYDALAARLGPPPPPHYDLRPYISPFGPALAAADLTVARAGGSIFEVAAHGLPAILVPYPHAAADHQTANARWMVDAGAAVVVPDGELSAERLRDEVGALLGDSDRLAAMAAASRGLARPDAARDIAREVLAAAESRS
jgi:UDP-N-acetylglucosamine--N-acetylmuramyl-(pentapeptide) pyrophosphoryl-undecaprenol N-acetylglucosamine transferase